MQIITTACENVTSCDPKQSTIHRLSLSPFGSHPAEEKEGRGSWWIEKQETDSSLRILEEEVPLLHTLLTTTRTKERDRPKTTENTPLTITLSKFNIQQSQQKEITGKTNGFRLVYITPVLVWQDKVKHFIKSTVNKCWKFTAASINATLLSHTH